MANRSQLPTDANDRVIPALRFSPDGNHHITFATANGNARNVTPFADGVKVVSLYATEDCYIKFGFSNSVTAADTDTFIPGGMLIEPAIVGADGSTAFTHIAVKGATSDGVLHVAERF